MKTTFSSGVIVTSKWLNGAKEIVFDGQDLDWHYNPLGLNSMVTVGPNGLDNRYITLGTNQPSVSSLGELITGIPISGAKVVTGTWWFGYPDIVNPGGPAPVDVPPSGNINPANIPEHAPRSYTTNTKYTYANGVPTPTIVQKFDALDNADIITKLILEDFYVDNGEF